jgi:hypothetical protein
VIDYATSGGGGSSETARLYHCPVDGLSLGTSRHGAVQSGCGDQRHHQPRLGDIMIAVQWRHMKLWFAGKAQNWELAAFELRQIKAGLSEAATLYPGIPVSNVTTMANLVQSIADAIKAKDTGRFTTAVVEMTDGCNACHKSTGRGFIVVRIPWKAALQQSGIPPAR